IPANSDEDRQLTSRLYGGDTRTRIRQEIILGIGGVRALTAMGIQPGVIHMNEGHSAFAGLEVIRQRIKDDALSFDEALRETAAMCVFTTHTPVPAGHDRFGSDLIEEHVGPLRDELGLRHDALMSLGRVEPQNQHEAFCMTVLAFKVCRRANAVSSLHGVVSRRMWAALGRGAAKRKFPSATSRTAFTWRHGSPSRCACCTTACCRSTGISAPASRRCGRRSKTSPRANCGKHTRP